MICLTTLEHECSSCAKDGMLQDEMGLELDGMGWDGMGLGWDGSVVWQKGRKIAFLQNPHSYSVTLNVKLISDTAASSKTQI